MTIESTAADRRRVLLAGATGLVGSQLLHALLADDTVGRIDVIGRRPPAVTDPRLRVHLVDFARLPALDAIDEAYLCLGTTIKVAGSQQAFRAVDLDANLAVATAAVAAGARRIAVVSAVGADARSTVFYNRVKGELEDALAGLPLTALVIAQPSLLLGERDALGQAPRPGEKFATPLARLVSPFVPGRYRPVAAKAVARALARTLPRATGNVVLSSDELARLGGNGA